MILELSPSVYEASKPPSSWMSTVSSLSSWTSGRRVTFVRRTCDFPYEFCQRAAHFEQGADGAGDQGGVVLRARQRERDDAEDDERGADRDRDLGQGNLLRGRRSLRGNGRGGYGLWESA